MALQKASKNSASQPKLSRWREDQDEDIYDPDKLLLCPYEPSHHIRACRFPYHIIKCRKNYPQLASELCACPFNASHLMRKDELSHHMCNCVNRCSINICNVEAPKWQHRFQVAVSTWTLPVCDEDWDQEEQEAVTPTPMAFRRVWPLQFRRDGTQHCMTNISAKQGLIPSVRSPRVLPWKVDQ